MLRAETRRALAIFAVIVWMLGFEIGPGLHVALHEVWGAHAHEGDRGSLAQHSGREHDHDHDHDHVHEHVHEHAHDHDDRLGRDEGGQHDAQQPGIDRGDHGRHSLAHRGVAVRTPPPAMPVVASAPWVDAPRHDLYQPPIRSRRPSATRARGPPLVTTIL